MALSALYMTVSGSIKMMHALNAQLADRGVVASGAFYSALHMNYDAFCRETPDFDEARTPVLKEWEITGDALSAQPDLEKLRHYEALLGENLMEAVIADRRLCLGRRATMRQDYAGRFTANQLRAILVTACERIETFLDAAAPDVIFSYNPVTFGEVLLWFFARSRNIPVLCLRTLKILNCVSFGESIYRDIEAVAEDYRAFMSSKKGMPFAQEARDYIARWETGDVKWEGFLLSGKKDDVPLSRKLYMAWRRLRYAFVSEYDYLKGGYHRDNHQPHPMLAQFFLWIGAPLQSRYTAMMLRDRYVPVRELENMDYALFPLHHEPEISLLLHNRNHCNQIESIRTFRNNLPPSMELVVKDHPATAGRRPLSYYRKILEIPGVRLCDPMLPAEALVRTARLVVSVAGSVAFDALLWKKPVVTMGRDLFLMLPPTMIRHVGDPDQLAGAIRDMLTNHEHDPEALVAYVAACMNNSVRVNLFTTLLERREARTGSNDGLTHEQRFARDIEVLADHAMERLQRIHGLKIESGEMCA